MKLIIDVPEIFYRNEKENKGYVSELKRDIVWDAMIKGTPFVEQEPILDRIRAEMFIEILSHSGTGEEVIQAYADGLKKGLDILDKYKAESED